MAVRGFVGRLGSTTLGESTSNANTDTPRWGFNRARRGDNVVDSYGNMHGPNARDVGAWRWWKSRLTDTKPKHTIFLSP